MRIYIESKLSPTLHGQVWNIGDRKGPRFRAVFYGVEYIVDLYPTGRVKWQGDIPMEIWSTEHADVQP